MATKLALKLAEKLKELTGKEFVPVIHRTRAGRHQKDAGAVSWFMLGPPGSGLWVGSQHTATECANAKKLISDKPAQEWWEDLYVFPEDA